MLYNLCLKEEVPFVKSELLLSSSQTDSSLLCSSQEGGDLEPALRPLL